PRVRLLHRVGGEEADRVDGELIQIGLPHRLLTARPGARPHRPTRFYGAGRPSGKGIVVPACPFRGLRILERAGMGPIDAPLEPGEQVVFRTGLHPMAFTGALTLALFVALVVMLLIRHNELPPPTEIQIALVGLAVAVIGAIPSFLRWRNTEL